MIKILLIFALPFTLYASKILSYNMYDRSDRVDVMITFDTPYDGIIKQSISESKIIIKLTDASIESTKLKQLSSKFLQSLSITPMSGYTQIVASVPNTVKLQASKTSDSYGLRLRFTTNASKTKTAQNNLDNTPLLSSLPTKKDGDISQSYYIVVTILLIGITLLFFLKKKIASKTPQKPTKSWLFKENQELKPQDNKLKSNDISIKFQKNINNDNSVVMLDFAEQSYLVLIGHNNILLDKFTDNKPVTQEDFETILQNRHQELDQFLQTTNEGTEPLQTYKERASTISYNV
jgi:fructose-specific phosphotransferase system component IIB